MNRKTSLAFILSASIILAGLAGGCARNQPVGVVSVVAGVQPINPGGPSIRLTLANNGTEPIVALSATIRFAGTPERILTYDFNVSTTVPLQPGNQTSSTQILIGPTGYDSTTDYPVTINATGQSGSTYSYTVSAKIGVAPPG